MGCNASKEAAPQSICAAEEGDVLILDLAPFVQQVHHDPDQLEFWHCSYCSGKNETELLVRRADLGLPGLDEAERQEILTASGHDNKRSKLLKRYEEEAKQKPKRLAKVKIGKDHNRNANAMSVWRKTSVTILEEVRGE